MFEARQKGVARLGPCIENGETQTVHRHATCSDDFVTQTAMANIAGRGVKSSQPPISIG